MGRAKAPKFIVVESKFERVPARRPAIHAAAWAYASCLLTATTDFPSCSTLRTSLALRPSDGERIPRSYAGASTYRARRKPLCAQPVLGSPPARCARTLFLCCYTISHRPCHRLNLTEELYMYFCLAHQNVYRTIVRPSSPSAYRGVFE